MPTREVTPRFLRDYSRLTKEQRREFLEALQQFVEGLRQGQFAVSPRIKAIQGREGVWELTWAHDGRATFEYGESIVPGERHVIWRRIGTHDVFRAP